MQAQDRYHSRNQHCGHLHLGPPACRPGRARICFSRPPAHSGGPSPHSCTRHSKKWKPEQKATRVNPQTDLFPKTTSVKVTMKKEPPNPS